jgi:hypothetical protein
VVARVRIPLGAVRPTWPCGNRMRPRVRCAVAVAEDPNAPPNGVPPTAMQQRSPFGCATTELSLSLTVFRETGRWRKVPLVPLTYTSCVTRLRSYWRWLGHRLWLSQPGRVFFTVALLVGVAGIAVARAHGDREGGAPLVVLALLLLGVVTLDAIGRGVVAVVRRLILDGGLRRHS